MIVLLGCFLIAFIALSSLADGPIRKDYKPTAVIVISLLTSTFGLLVLGPSEPGGTPTSPKGASGWSHDAAHVPTDSP